MFKIILFCALLGVTIAKNRSASLKPLSVCCEIPEMGKESDLLACSNPKPDGPCNDLQCVFEKSGFLTDNSTLNTEAYKQHLLDWAKDNPQFTLAINKVIKDCVEKDTRQLLEYSCKAYDVFACTTITLIKKCPDEAWSCNLP